MRCPKCRNRLVEIAVSLGDTELTMHSCSRCDARWWDQDGRLIDLQSVLALAASRR